ncbi:MAG: redoxin domain-containing protein [Gemmatimonadales bacterium]
MLLSRTLVLQALLVGWSGPLAGQGATLGPKDGTRLTPTDTGRVTVGMIAPDFTLEALSGPPVTLSQYRGQKNVVLVFYRGHW